MELNYKSGKEQREFNKNFNKEINDKYGYKQSYITYEITVKEEDLNKNIEKANIKYGTDNIQDLIAICKTKIYEYRLKRANERYAKKIDEKE
ncbi:hypothetical protein [Romboutsia sp. 1001713B170131_170501_G6]|uniref:hypothetical protein n=1 Tax=Romboutsia sp. 1001713B170131_170501_G6 TaxID=2787108 RepID=UPI0018AC52CE|nr:hypothetical protein [Romboutsia sp. 1001713B170131_170501_G6]